MLKEPLYEQISKDHVLIIPDQTPVKIKKICTSNYIFLREPSSLKIPKDCQVEIDDVKFNMNKDIIQGKPFSLPEFAIVNTSAPTHMSTITPEGHQLRWVNQVTKASFSLTTNNNEASR